MAGGGWRVVVLRRRLHRLIIDNPPPLSLSHHPFTHLPLPLPPQTQPTNDQTNDDREFHQETVDKLKALHLYDCLRANKATSAWGVEVRVPFLDRDFLDVAMTINPEDKMIKKVCQSVTKGREGRKGEGGIVGGN